MSILKNNKILDAAEAELESKLAPENKANYEKIVVAGMKAGMAGGEASLLASLKKSRDPVTSCAKGAISLVLMLRHQSKGVMPITAMIPAAYTLMLKALAFSERLGLVTVGADELAKATHVFTNSLFTALQISPKKLNSMAEMTHGVMSDPTKMEELNRRAGIVKDPRASTPTVVPTTGRKAAAVPQ